MSSPVTKLCRLSRLLSASSLKSPNESAPLLCTPKLTNSADLSLLPDTFVRHVDTPTDERSPTHCSTPAVRNNTLEVDYNAQSLSLESNSYCSPLQSSLSATSRPKSEMSNLRTVLTRKRHFGISNANTSSVKKVKREHGQATSSGSAHVMGDSSSSTSLRKCKAFSSSVIPCVSPKQFTKSRILRLSGISLSPTSVSWTAESPLIQQQSGDYFFPPKSFYYPVGPNQEKTNGRLQESTESCPPGKLYFWEENEEEIVFSDRLGRGGFGQVFRGLYRGKQVAIKKLDHAFKSRQVILETIQGEMHGLRLCHPNVVRTLVVVHPSPSPDTKIKINSCYVIMEQAGHRNLSQLINDSDEEIPDFRRYKFCCDILGGLAYLHSLKLAHLDLKPSNVIVTSYDICKLCDFGSCCVVSNPKKCDSITSSRDSNITSSYDSVTNSSIFSGPTSSSTNSAKSSSQLMGTYIYRAPELLRGYLPTEKADIFSFSITAWQIWSRVPPYSGQHNHAAVFAVVALGARPFLPQITGNYSTSSERSEKKFFELLTSCWQADAANRPTAEQAYESFKGCLKLVEKARQG